MSPVSLNHALQSSWRAYVHGLTRFSFEAFRDLALKSQGEGYQSQDQDFDAALSDLVRLLHGCPSVTDFDVEGIDRQMDKLQAATRRASDARVGDQGPAIIYVPGFGERAEIMAQGLISMGLKTLTWDMNANPELETQLGDRMPASTLLLVGAAVVESAECVERIAAMSNDHDSDLLVIIAADKPLTFAQRMTATAFGSVRVLGPETDVKALREMVRSRARDSQLQGHKVLLVDDSRTDAYLACKYMREEGLEVLHIQDPSQVLDAIETFRPDVVVSDFHMPGANGDQVASVIRQDQEATMPIVFLSSEGDVETQLMALAKGADGFVQKPLKRGAFIKALKSLISRSKVLEARMRRDPLTNLLNRGQFMASAARAKDGDQSSAIVLIDIDHFKTVNDTFGHPVGDKVLIGLAEILGESLRSTDFVGRLGGEEFGVVMVGASVSDSVTVIDRIRELFSSVQFATDVEDSTAPGESFACTFSAGVAPLAGSVGACIKAADEALYRAKRAGRNQVVLAE